MNSKATITHSTIQPRHMGFEINNDLSNNWHSNDIFITAFFNAMSILFPIGERFFIETVRHFRDEIKDPILLEDIKGFIGQEGQHSQEHKKYNDALVNLGYDVDHLEGLLKTRMEFMKKKLSPIRLLAGTVAFEHFTAILAEVFLKDGGALENANPNIAKMWQWHAIEEIEHKAVAFDVYQQSGGKYWMRVRVMILVSYFMAFFTARNLIHILKKEGKLFSPKIWWSGLKFLFGKPGIIRKTLPTYLDYYKPSFHPWQHNNTHLIEQWENKLANQGS